MNNKAPIARNLVNYLFLSLVSLIIMLPFFLMVTTALKEPNNIFLFPPQWFPNPIRWFNFIELFDRIPFHIQLFNSVYIATLATIGTCIFGAMGGYAFAKIRFKGKNVIFLILLSSMMIPNEATIIPLFIWMSKLKLINTHIPLILPPMLGAGGMFGVFLMRQFFITAPDSLIEAAKIDGCGPVKTFFQIMLPLAKPALAALFIYTFLNMWNEFLNPLVFVNSTNLYTVPLALSMLTDQVGTEWHLVMAGSVLATFPLLLVFVFAQKHFIQGIAMTGIKG